MESTVFFRAHAPPDGRCVNFTRELKLRRVSVRYDDARYHLLWVSAASKKEFVKVLKFFTGKKESFSVLEASETPEALQTRHNAQHQQ